MERANAYRAGKGLVFGTAIGYAIGLVLADASTAPIVAAAGAGIGLWSARSPRRCGVRAPDELIPIEGTL